MTIRNLLAGRSTIQQLEILQRADRVVPFGRYYGGLLTAQEVQALTKGLR